MSGSTWSRALPIGWRIYALKHCANIANSNVDKKTYEGGMPVRLCNYTDVYNNEYVTSDLDYMAATATAQEVERFALQRGDVIITKDSESWDDIAVPACVKEPLSGVVCGYHLTLLRPFANELHGRYLLRCLQASGVREQFWVAANGVTRFGLGLNGIRNALLPVPSLEVQRSIADFLDRRTQTIDELIRKKERLIELLQEKRQALITHAVTKGLDPSVPMKDSGVEWLGEIPAHWEVVALRRSTIEHRQGYYTSEQYGDHGARLARITDIDDVGRISFDEMPRLSVSKSVMRDFDVRKGDFLFARSGSIGRFAYVDNDPSDPVIFASYLIRFRFDSRICGKFLSFLFLSSFFRQRLRLLHHGGVNQNVHAEDIKSQYITLPPRDEQMRIACALSRHFERGMHLESRLAESVARLREYRQSLISAAVTGQLEIPTTPDPTP